MLQQMAGQAGEIFVGRVVEIHLMGDSSRNFPDWPDGAGLVSITLQAEDCVLGCATGQLVQMREWAALWRGQPHRYTPGQRALWFLYPPNAAGVSSPVNGMLGVLPVKSTVAHSSSTETANAETAAGQSVPQVDLRWVQTAVLTNRTQVAAGAVIHPLGEVGLVPTAATTESTSEIETPTAPLTAVMGVLHAFAEAKTTAAR
jgi:hypothetical protein